MNKHYVVLFVIIGILTTLTLMFGILFFDQELRYDLIHKESLKSPEVVLFHEKYGDSVHRPLNHAAGIAYTVTDNNDYIELQYHIDHMSNRSLNITCKSDFSLNEYAYGVNDVMGYLQNYNCFTDKYNYDI